jgi:hypothetical protein
MKRANFWFKVHNVNHYTLLLLQKKRVPKNEKHRANLRHALQLLSWVATNATVRREAEPMDEMTETDGSSTVSRDDEKIAVIAASYTEILKVTRNTSTSPTFLTA